MLALPHATAVVHKIAFLEAIVRELEVMSLKAVVFVALVSCAMAFMPGNSPVRARFGQVGAPTCGR